MHGQSQEEFRSKAVKRELASAELQRELTILERWGISAEYLTKVVDDNPSLRGMIVGYIAERKLREFFEKDKRVSGLRKDDDHDREKKGDLVLFYKEREFKIEVKSLQTNDIKYLRPNGEIVPLMLRQRNGVNKAGNPKYRYVRNSAFDEISHSDRLNGKYRGKFQCDASDRRVVELPGGEAVETTCLRVGEFDILAAGLFGFREKWDFGFALNCDLPTSTSSKYPPHLRSSLLTTSMQVAWPLTAPFVADPFILLDRLIQERERKKP